MRRLELLVVGALGLALTLAGCSTAPQACDPAHRALSSVEVQAVGENVSALQLRVCDGGICTVANASGVVAAARNGQRVQVRQTAAGDWTASFRRLPAHVHLALLQGGDNLIVGQERKLAWPHAAGCKAARIAQPVVLHVR